MATMEFEATPVPLRMTDDGIIMVGRTRVPLETVIHAFCRGETPEDIVQSFTTLKLTDVYAVITYYLHNKAKLDPYFKKQEEERQRLREEIEARFPSDGLRARLLARLQKNA
jgi:uncharacterized protein (DUF433 family)